MQARQSSHAPAIGPGVTGGPLAHPERPTNAADADPHATLIPTSGNEGLVVDPAALGGGDGFKSHTQYPYVTGRPFWESRTKTGSCSRVIRWGRTAAPSGTSRSSG